MSEKQSKRILIVAVVWLVIIGGLAVAYKQFLHPYFSSELENETGSNSRYKYDITVTVDSFSGYAVLRSETFANDLKKQGIRLNITDDGADYAARIRALEDGDTDFAVFTVDSLLATSVDLGRFPGTIVLVIDETRGADAIVAPKGGITSVQELNHPDARIVLTPSSPSEFLARTVVAHFVLPDLPDNWIVEKDGSGDVLTALQADRGGTKNAYVLWEPHVSQARADGATVLLGSDKLKGYIIDVLVARREFVLEQPDLLKTVIQSYLRTAYTIRTSSGGLKAMVQADASAAGDPLNNSQADALVNGIHWTNTLENYAYFGLLSTVDAKGIPYLEDVIDNIARVLVDTDALPEHPLEGRSNTLFYNQALRDLKAASFHPSRTVNIIDGMGPGTTELDAITQDYKPIALSDAQWGSLRPVGNLKVNALSFGRGTARLNIRSVRELERLAGQLAAWPQYYIIVTGQARSDGDSDANRALAKARAQAAADALTQHGIDPVRIRTTSRIGKHEGGRSQTVVFTLGQLPY
jgi:ABC-type nitrate/sulfonate/bicarbonate transport system substrate-binding protein/outer membrane protein OmpA-like peptidoglycan-associated protein